MFEIITVLKDEVTELEVNVVLRKSDNGIHIEFPDKENVCVAVDLFDGKVSALIWEDNEDEDFDQKTHLFKEGE